MEKPTKIFIGGALCAALVAGVGWLNTARIKSNLLKLEAQCAEDGKRERERTGLDLTLLCDGATLESTGSLVGIQEQIANAHRDIRNSPAMPGLIAIGCSSFLPSPGHGIFYCAEYASCAMPLWENDIQLIALQSCASGTSGLENATGG